MNYIDKVLNDKYQVLTPSGWSDFCGVKQVKASNGLKIIFQNDQIIQCTQQHKLKCETGQFVQCCELKVGFKVKTDNGLYIIKDIQSIDSQKLYFDLIDVQKFNQYYTNKIVSHNCIMLSTPRGVGNTFHRLWTEAQQGRNKFNTITLPWYLHPERDQKWREQQTQAMGEKQAARQCDCNFATSGDQLLPSQSLEYIQKNTVCQPIEKLHRDQLWIFKHVEFEKTYILSADVARGDGADFSAFHVICIEDNEQVAEYKGKITTQDFGELIVNVAKLYNEAFVVVENLSIGWAVLQEIVNQDYKNVYYHKKDYKYIDPELHSRIKPNRNSDKQKDIIGFSTSSRTRPLIIQKTFLTLQNKQFIIRSIRTLNELQTFIWINGKPQSMKGYNDDLVMSLCIGVWVRFTSYIIQKEARKFAKSRISAISSGLNNRMKYEQSINSGFFNTSTTNTQQGIVAVGNEEINLQDFYFGKINKEKE